MNIEKNNKDIIEENNNFKEIIDDLKNKNSKLFQDNVILNKKLKDFKAFNLNSERLEKNNFTFREKLYNYNNKNSNINSDSNLNKYKTFFTEENNNNNYYKNENKNIEKVNNKIIEQLNEDKKKLLDDNIILIKKVKELNEKLKFYEKDSSQI
jgi:hypothetical protein